MNVLACYMKRLSPEYTVLFIKGCVTKDKALMECDAVIEWTTTGKNAGLFRAA
jgi:hypothetical protein